MNVFEGNFGAIVEATYVEENRKNPLGVVAGDAHNVNVIVDESYASNWQSDMVSQNWDIMIYGKANSVLNDSTCVGGILKIDERRLRIETYAVARNQRTGRVAHIELGCSEL